MNNSRNKELLPIENLDHHKQLDVRLHPDLAFQSYEEGQNVTVQAALRDDGDKWMFGDVKHTLNIGLAMLEERSTREIFEIGWRLSILTKVEDNQEVDVAMIQRAKRAMLGFIDRFERSRPAKLPDFAGQIVFTKDLAYLRGRIAAVPVIAGWAKHDDRTSFFNAHKAKIDPTSSRQNQLAKDAGLPITVPMMK